MPVLPTSPALPRKGLRCGYHNAPTPTPLAVRGPDLPVAAGLLSTRPLHYFTVPAGNPAVSEINLHVLVQRSIRAAGLFVDDVSSRYFKGIHRYLPTISRSRFQHDLIGPGAVPSAGFSVLLLAMCLTHSCPTLERRAHASSRNPSQVDYDSLHLTAMTLFVQVQAQCPPSLYLLQAGLLLAVYEYISGRPDKAFASISGCARMAYAARIHVCNQQSPQPPWRPIDAACTALAYRLQVQEAANTWWGIFISERLLERDDFLDAEIVPHIPVSYLTSVGIESFGRAAQAAWLLDQVTKALDISDASSQLFQLHGLDATLQSFLVALMQQCSAGQEKFCEAIAITIRKTEWEKDGLLQSAEERLRTSLDEFSQHREEVDI
ncbi:uncharacterized protein J7T54_005265 [Emericellopsis cladophorae]|uniref:Xylanolytic transcriptional activator regulatory domain-containing protein n=1 Tax=Emericellopsis cladophorae TaxID=2686198 RepID=A0A9P9Y108_9HYPO|nr:uncharacterized protein J7T54_005265 [Emericellopsis cladophorae]KAI6781554.1 hypothetical protein J7T54_005265 [Emericellopsis cladophorae]